MSDSDGEDTAARAEGTVRRVSARSRRLGWCLCFIHVLAGVWVNVDREFGHDGLTKATVAWGAGAAGACVGLGVAAGRWVLLLPAILEMVFFAVTLPLTIAFSTYDGPSFLRAVVMVIWAGTLLVSVQFYTRGFWTGRP